MYDRVSTFLETLYRDMEKGGCGDNAFLVSHGLFCIDCFSQDTSIGG